MDKNLFVEDPFRSIDGAGVSNLIRFAKRKCKTSQDNVRVRKSLVSCTLSWHTLIPPSFSVSIADAHC
ncbi:hypothetical protein EON65_41805 [archaeon]|nr:MAG: hypothetical protein EON65_41805 [archaeon]